LNKNQNIFCKILKIPIKQIKKNRASKYFSKIFVLRSQIRKYRYYIGWRKRNLPLADNLPPTKLAEITKIGIFHRLFG